MWAKWDPQYLVCRGRVQAVKYDLGAEIVGRVKEHHMPFWGIGIVHVKMHRLGEEDRACSIAREHGLELIDINHFWAEKRIDVVARHSDIVQNQ
jgi:hypothetical protein